MPLLSSFGVQLQALDGLNLPSPTDPSRARYKEWQHFYLLDERNHLHAIFNLNLAGGPNRRARAGAGRVVAAVLEHDRGWRGEVEPVAPADLQLQNRQIDMRLGRASLCFDGTAYRLNVAAGRGGIGGELNFRPLTAPLLMRNNTPVGRGYLNWLVVPWLAVDGELEVEGRGYAVRGGQGYHDHNWGRWDWGDDFAWEWGFAVPGTAQPGQKLAFVFDRTTDRRRLAAKELTVAVWDRDELARVFTRREVALHSDGFLQAGRLLKLPRIMALVEPQHTHDIPATVTIAGATGSDTFEARFHSEQAVQVVVPNDVNLENTIINEVFGRLTAHGRIKEQPFEFSGLAFFEFLT